MKTRLIGFFSFDYLYMNICVVHSADDKDQIFVAASFCGKSETLNSLVVVLVLVVKLLIK